MRFRRRPFVFFVDWPRPFAVLVLLARAFDDFEVLVGPTGRRGHRDKFSVGLTTVFSGVICNDMVGTLIFLVNFSSSGDGHGGERSELVIVGFFGVLLFVG